MPTTFQEIPRKRPSTPLLDRAATPDGLRRLGEAELETLADELRLELLYTVGQTGGHFGAGLGVIELTIALHYVFDTPDDRLVWDVGHQAYPHKILTGRRERMSTLLVFTQDWKILRKLTADAAKIEQEYVVEVEGDMVAHGLNRLNHGLTYKGKELPAVKASWQNENRLRFAMKNPQPGVIALFCEAVGLKVVAIRRIRIGGVSIGKVPVGQWRYLSGKEKF